MQNSYHKLTRIAHDGLPVLDKLPFAEGDEVDVTITPIEKTSPVRRTFPFRGLPFSYIDPFGPACDDQEWEALKHDPS